MRFRCFLPILAAGPLLAISACGDQQDIASKEMTAPAEAPAPEPDATDKAPVRDANEESPAAQGSRLEAHVHGHASLAAAVDGNQVTFTFEAPLASLVGFEHSPETEEQQAAINELKDAFVVPGSMVAINTQAGCLPVTTSSGTHMSGGHGALEVAHVYTCDHPGQIETIEFLMMSDYPALETIEAVFLSGTVQSARELTPGNPVLEVR